MTTCQNSAHISSTGEFQENVCSGIEYKNFKASFSFGKANIFGIDACYFETFQWIKAKI